MRVLVGLIPAESGPAISPAPGAFVGCNPCGQLAQNAGNPVEHETFVCPRVAYRITSFLHRCKYERNKINIWLR